ncbi:MAG: NfeD family protein [Acidimicrobiia bacterium]|nr:NfeD family protein [Acidimicrobiia bacterium]
MDNPDVWLWIWLGTTVLFTVGEITVAGSFFLLPFAAGAVLAAVGAALGAALVVQWLLFVIVSGGAFFALRPLARRLDISAPADGIGARRLIGETARIIDAIPIGDLGLALIGREEWRVESMDGSAVAEGTLVRVVEVRGTRAVVFPVDLPGSTDSPERPSL